MRPRGDASDPVNSLNWQSRLHQELIIEGFDWIVLLIPLISAIVGWGTNVVAVRMMFSPIDFVGIPPILGWQGIVPANAKELAAASTDLITTKLINLRTVFDEFDADGNEIPEADRVGRFGRFIRTTSLGTRTVIASAAFRYASALGGVFCGKSRVS